MTWPSHNNVEGRKSQSDNVLGVSLLISFGVGGHAYIYLCFGLHSRLNIVADQEGVEAAVLVRSCAPVMVGEYSNGVICKPRNLFFLLGLRRLVRHISTEWFNRPLFEPGGLEVLDGPEPEKILMGPQVGIDYALPEHVNALWRFAIAVIKFSQDYRSEDKSSITDDRISHLLPTLPRHDCSSLLQKTRTGLLNQLF
ncbi:hypothetical protein OROGR_007570 [Orobanche gracilis]